MKKIILIISAVLLALGILGCAVTALPTLLEGEKYMNNIIDKNSEKQEFTFTDTFSGLDISVLSANANISYNSGNEVKVSYVTVDKNKKIECYHFYSGEDLLRSSEHFDVIFLDIEMENMNGMETAAEIRKTDTDVVIVILSGYAIYKNQAYALHVFDYIDKPVEENKILNILEEIERYRIKNAPIYFSFRSKDTMLKIKKEDILYFEYYDRNTWLYTTTGKYVTNYTIAKLNEKLKDYDFFSPHRAFLVNFYHIYSYTANRIIIDDQLKTEIPISQLKTKEFKEKFIQYLTKAALEI